MAECRKHGRLDPTSLQAALCRAQVHTRKKTVESMLGRRKERGESSAVEVDVVMMTADELEETLANEMRRVLVLEHRMCPDESPRLTAPWINS